MSGELTIEEVERRLLRALLTLDAVADPDARYQAPTPSQWPDWVQDYHATHDPETLRSATPKAARFQPTPEDVDDMLTALGWIRGNLRHRVWIARWRAYGVSFRAIADRRGFSHEFWRRVYQDFIQEVFTEARRRIGDAAA